MTLLRELRSVEDRPNLARELRVVEGAVELSLEIRSEDEGKVTFDGTASVVDTPYMVRDAFGEFEETIVKGAFNKTLKEKATSGS